MTTLIDSLKVALADAFAFYLKSHNYHFNVIGNNFYEYHTFLEKIYTQVFEEFDSIGEKIRTLNEYTPASFTRFIELTNIDDALTVPSSQRMFETLHEDNLILTQSLETAYHAAELAGEIGISNFLQDLVDKHNKLSWMLKATISTI